MVQDVTGMPGGIQVDENSNKQFLGGIGLVPFQVLDVAADVVLDQTVTIGSDVYRVGVVATDSGKVTANGELNKTGNEDVVLSMASHGLVVGDVIKVENEVLQVIGVPGPHQINLMRGVSGTTIAAHANAIAIYTEAGPGDAGIAVVGTALTPAAFTDAFAADVNNPRRGRERVAAITDGDNTVIVYRAKTKGGDPEVGTATTATTETLAGAGNAWQAATMLTGRATKRGSQLVTIVPTAADVTAGFVRRVFDFTPVIDWVEVHVTATRTYKAWDGAPAVVGKTIKLDNAGATDWAATDTILLWISG